MAVTERNLLSNVSRGENTGRRLAHTAVVRSLRVMGKTRAGEAISAELSPPLDPAWKAADLLAVVFLQQRPARRILGGAEIPLPPAARIAE